MASDEKQIVAQHNDLIQAVAKMERMPLKLFEIIVGSYDDRKNTDIFCSSFFKTCSSAVNLSFFSSVLY